ncbi:MAG: hypothetical protein WCB68_15735 [Pyrinomonadaceae bacterium]
MIKIFVSMVFLLLTMAPAAIAQSESNQRSSTYQWRDTSEGTELSVTVRNDVRFNEEYTDVIRVGDDSFFQAREKRGGLTRQLKVTAGANGEPVRSYSVNGEARAFDAGARAWLKGMMVEAVADGFDSSARVSRILKQQGARGVLEEIPRLKGDHVKRAYLEALVKNENLNTSDLQQAFRVAAREISSDYEKATFLINASGAHRGNAGALATYFAAIETVKSDYEHARVLKSGLKTKDVSRELLMLTITSAAKIGSDYEKANVLIEVVKSHSQDKRIRAALLDAIKTLDSDHERGRVLQVVYLNESK